MQRQHQAPRFDLSLFRDLASVTKLPDQIYGYANNAGTIGQRHVGTPSKHTLPQTHRIFSYRKYSQWSQSYDLT